MSYKQAVGANYTEARNYKKGEWADKLVEASAMYNKYDWEYPGNLPYCYEEEGVELRYNAFLGMWMGYVFNEFKLFTYTSAQGVKPVEVLAVPRGELNGFTEDEVATAHKPYAVVKLNNPLLPDKYSLVHLPITYTWHDKVRGIGHIIDHHDGDGMNYAPENLERMSYQRNLNKG